MYKNWFIINKVINTVRFNSSLPGINIAKLLSNNCSGEKVKVKVLIYITDLF